MPILRAGPWGNLTDSFQDVPLNTSGQLSYYPVNCAKTDWPSQTWAAYYERTVPPAGDTVTITPRGGTVVYDLGSLLVFPDYDANGSHLELEYFGPGFGWLLIDYEWDGFTLVPIEEIFGPDDVNPEATYFGTYETFTCTTTL